MEKFRSTADPSTGIHPFIPPSRPFTALTIPLILLRLPVFVIGALITLLLTPLLHIPIPFLPRIVSRFRAHTGIYLMLFGLGVLSHTAPRYARSAKTGKDRIVDSQSVIVCNHASLLDVLYLERLFSPTFVGGQEWGLLVQSSGHLDKVSRNSGPNVVFPEGCRTNGKGLLQFSDETMLEEVEPINVWIGGINYGRQKGECYTLGSMVKEIFNLMGRPRNEIALRIEKANEHDLKNLQEAVAGVAKIPHLKIGRKEWLKFVEHWKSTQSRYK